MNIINQKVKHSSLGTGTIIEQSDNYVTIMFPSKTSKFKYPDAFTKFIEADDCSVQSSIVKDFDATEAAEVEKKTAQESARKVDEDFKLAEESARRMAANERKFDRKQPTKYERLFGKPMVFFVFQGNTFDKESKGGYLWAPITNKAGTNVHHWNRLMDVREGDIVLHGCDGFIVAISTARIECYECPQPEELLIEDLWEHDGRRIDCNYIMIQHPIKTSDFKDNITSLSIVKYSPFNRNGSGNIGYLYEINRELARIFISESTKSNKYLLEYEAIKDFLEK